jgi:hypothetical protein
LLIAAPWIFQYADETTEGTLISVLAGIALIGISTETNYEGGFLARALPIPSHLLADGILGLARCHPVASWFADQGANCVVAVRRHSAWPRSLPPPRRNASRATRSAGGTRLKPT